MPTYVYKFIDTGETVEVQQSFIDDTLSEFTHPESGEVMAVKKVFQPVGVTFKGSGFFKTDNRGKSTSTAGNGSSSDAGKSDGSSSGESSSGESSSGEKSSSGSDSGTAASTKSSSGSSSGGSSEGSTKSSKTSSKISSSKD